MKLKPVLETCVLALPLAVLLCSWIQARDGSQSIADVRFDGPFRQIESSFGDEWAPTWGRDDVLYTANDDGTSFGGILENAIAFGELMGGDPNQLTPRSVSSMRTFRELPYAGPEGAAWQTLDSYRVADVLYQFVPCENAAKSSGTWCISVSANEGKTWSSSTTTRLIQAPNQRSPTFVVLSDATATLLNSLPRDAYVFAVTYEGVIGSEDGYVLRRTLKANFGNDIPIDWSIFQTDNTWRVGRGSPYLFVNHTFFGPDGANWKATNSYSIDGALYMFVTRCIYPSASSDPKHRHIWQNSSIIKSLDNGKTWNRDGEENYRRPMFPGQRFGAPYFIWYGKDGEAAVDGAQSYVYAVSNNGFFENGDNYVLGRVLRSKIGNLSAADWSFYKSGDGLQDRNWSPNLAEGMPILENTSKAGMTGITYIEGLHRYVMVPWHYHRDNFEQGIKEHDLGTVLEFFESPKPWGPWTKIKSFDTGKLGWYAPVIGQRFQTRVGTSMVKAFLYTTGFNTVPEGGLDFTLYKFTSVPILLSTKPLPHNDPAYVGGH